jgi:hypothetical protein
MLRHDLVRVATLGRMLRVESAIATHNLEWVGG